MGALLLVACLAVAAGWAGLHADTHGGVDPVTFQMLPMRAHRDAVLSRVDPSTSG